MVVSWCGYLSLRTGIKPASSFQVCPPRNHGAGWSPGLLCVPETYPALLLRVPQEPGRQRDFLETGAQAKLGTEGAQSQAWLREGGVDSRPGGEGCSPHTPPLPPAGFSPEELMSSSVQCTASEVVGLLETLPWGQEEVERGPWPRARPCISLFQRINLQIQA